MKFAPFCVMPALWLAAPVQDLCGQGLSAVKLETVGALDGVGASRAVDVNDAGQVVGYSKDGSFNRAFLWKDGKMTNLGSLNGGHSVANAINESGQIVGVSVSPDFSLSQAFLFKDGEPFLLGGGSIRNAIDINASGLIIGQQGRKLVKISPDGDIAPVSEGVSASLSAVNDLGLIVGTFESSAFDFHDRPGKIVGSQFVDIGGLGGSNGFATAVNNAGQIAGTAQTAGGEEHPFIHDGVMKDLGFVGQANGINGSGWVVGRKTKPNTSVNQAFVYDGTTSYVLDDLAAKFLSDGSTAGFLSLESALAANDKGQVVGFGLYLDGQGSGMERGFVLTLASDCETTTPPDQSLLDGAGPIRPHLVAIESQRLPASHGLFSPRVVGFNDASILGLVSSSTCSTTSDTIGNVLARIDLGGATPTAEIASFPTSPERRYIPLGLDEAGRIVSFDIFDRPDSDDDPALFTRSWGNGSFQALNSGWTDLAADEPAGLEGTVLLRRASPNGAFLVVTVDRGAGVDTVVFGASGVPLRTFGGVVGYGGPGPFDQELFAVADNGSFLGALDADRKAVAVYQATGPAVPLGAEVVGARLSRKGDLVAAIARSGDDQEAALTIRSLGAGPPGFTAKVAASRSDEVVDVFESRDTSKPKKTSISGGIAAFRDVLGIENVESPLGRQYMVVVEGIDPQGAAHFYFARGSMEDGRLNSSSMLPRVSGAVYATADAHLEDANALLNGRGAIVVEERARFDPFGTPIEAESQFALFRPHDSTHFKQSSLGQILSGLEAEPETRWFDKPVNPELAPGSRQTFGSVGCTLTSMANICGAYGFEITPLEVRNIQLGLGAMRNNSTVVSQFRLTVEGKTLARVYPLGGDFQSIVTELRGGNPVLLMVPIKGSTGVAMQRAKDENGAPLVDGEGKPILVEAGPRPDGTLRFNGNGHYIAALGIDPTVPAGGEVGPEHIFVGDPAYQYRSKYGADYTAGEERVNVTLADYFERIAASPVFTFDAESWFDLGVFFRFDQQTGRVETIRLDSWDKDRQIQRWRLFDGPVPEQPVVEVNSPVELAIEVDGTRYVSDPSMATEGDVVLQKDLTFLAMEFDEQSDGGVKSSTGEFPHYHLALPPELIGRSLPVDIAGVAEGPYRISLRTGSKRFRARNELQGSIVKGEMRAGTIEVEGTGAPYAAWVSQYPALGAKTHFTEDADGDGLENGLERYFGLRPDRVDGGAMEVTLPGPGLAAIGYTRALPVPIDTAVSYEWSADLVSWHPSGASADGGLTVSVSTEFEPGDGAFDRVVATATANQPIPELFLRIKLTFVGEDMKPYQLPPLIVKEPVGAAVAKGGAFELEATVDGTGVISLQWYKDGEALEGENRSVLSVEAAESSDSGTYFLKATSALGVAISKAVAVTVLD